MAGTIVVDRIESDASYASTINVAGQITFSNTVNFGATAQRITGDFSNATLTNRVTFQTSTANGATFVGALPNGTGTNAAFATWGVNDPTNSIYLAIRAFGTTETRIDSGFTGTASASPMTFYTGGSERMRIDTSGNLLFNSGYGSVATAYGCRAWVNFNGSTNTNLTGTYSQSGTTVTVTATAHGYIVGSIINADITSGTGVDGIYTVTAVTNANTFTYTAGTSLTTSGNVTLLRNTIRASGNVSSITDNGIGDYTVNFTTALVDANYSANVTADVGGVADFAVASTGDNSTARTTSLVRFRIGTTGGLAADSTVVQVAIFR